MVNVHLSRVAICDISHIRGIVLKNAQEMPHVYRKFKLIEAYIVGIQPLMAIDTDVICS